MITQSSNLAGVPALVHDPRPAEVAHDAVGESALDADGVHPLVELADPLPPTHPAVLGLARRDHSLAMENISSTCTLSIKTFS